MILIELLQKTLMHAIVLLLVRHSFPKHECRRTKGNQLKLKSLKFTWIVRRIFDPLFRNLYFATFSSKENDGWLVVGWHESLLPETLLAGLFQKGLPFWILANSCDNGWIISRHLIKYSILIETKHRSKVWPPWSNPHVTYQVVQYNRLTIGLRIISNHHMCQCFFDLWPLARL